MTTLSMTVNGKEVSGDVESRTLLVQFIREHLTLTGTHVGCDTSQCGACTIHVNGVSIKSCTMLAVQADGADIKTIEGVAHGKALATVGRARAIECEPAAGADELYWHRCNLHPGR